MSKSQPPAKNGSIFSYFKPKSQPVSSASAPAQSTKENVKASTAPPANKRARVDSIETSHKRGTPPTASTSKSLPSPTPSGSSNVLNTNNEILQTSDSKPPVQDNHDSTDGATSGKALGAGSSFSSVRSSQASKRIVQHGQEVVKGSDSETDGSDTELEDLSTLLGKFKPRSGPSTATQKPSVGTTTAKSKITQNGTLSMSDWQKGATKTTLGAFRPRPAAPKYAYSIEALAMESQRKAAMEARIAANEEKMKQNNDDYEMTGINLSPQKEAMRAALIENGDTEDDGKARRVINALVRTEAFEHNEVWRFFNTNSTGATRKAFPRIMHENKMLATVLNDPARREQAFLSGFMTKLANILTLPDELMHWMLDEICRERRENLVSAYAEVFSATVSPTSSCLAFGNLRSHFESLGAAKESTNTTGLMPVTEEPLNKTKNVSLHPNLAAFVDLLGSLSEKLSMDARDSAILLLIRTSIDHSVLAHADLCNRVQNSLTRLLGSYPAGPELSDAFLRISKAVFNSLKSPILRQRLISILPRSTFLAHNFRRHLALAFALDKSKYLDSSLENTALTSRVILAFARNPLLRITSTTDYLALRARLAMLDAAIDSGFSDLAFLEQRNKVDEETFNRGIDNLTGVIRDMMSKILDAGAAHMRRTEAKALAERVAQRLEYAVRSKEKPPTDWFGDKDMETERDAMEKWIQKGSDVKSEGVTIVDEGGQVEEVAEIDEGEPATAVSAPGNVVNQDAAPVIATQTDVEDSPQTPRKYASNPPTGAGTEDAPRTPRRAEIITPIRNRKKDRLAFMHL